ncbi:MAG: sensor histidine kinase N-terminal domain-containing protein [Sulfuricella sp.]|nr:sensor histidine kinase N-terminal domain-containing protein [Sulfuricella sp.]
MNEDILSLRNHLMNWLFTPLFVLWIFSTASGYMATVNYANQPYDLALIERARALATQLNLGGQPQAAGVVPGSGEKVYYLVTATDGRVIAGNARLPRPPALLSKRNEPVFSDGEYKGEKVRMVSMHYRFPADPSNEVLFQMAETTGKRLALTRGILGNIVIPQLLLIIMAGGAVWYALKRGLMPLEHLRQEVAQRTRDDLSLLDENKAPVEVKPLIDAVNDLLQRLKLVMESQRRFVADAAHQLRTPFAGLKTQAELALRETDPERVHQSLEKILASAERCNHLVNQLLSLARNEPGGHSYSSFETLELNRLAQDVAMQWVPEALKKNIDLGFEGSRQVLPVRGDALAIKEMIGNLLDNAIRYTPEGGTVTLRVDYENGGSVLRVEDNGPGITEEHRERVFERFYRILGSGQQGSGLGLPIVREVAKLHGALIALDEGAGGHGTLVTVRFPHHSEI